MNSLGMEALPDGPTCVTFHRGKARGCGGEVPITSPAGVSMLLKGKAAGVKALLVGHDSFCMAPGAGCSVCEVCGKQTLVASSGLSAVTLFAELACEWVAGDVYRMRTKVGCA